MNDTAISNLINEYIEITTYLKEQKEISKVINLSQHYKKVLLLSCASLYEKYFTDEIQRIIAKKTGGAALKNLFYNKSIKQQYFKFFDWKESKGNINGFLKLFGNEIYAKIQSEINQKEELKQGMDAFLKLGYNRNLLVHENFIEFALDKTFEEIQSLHNLAYPFLIHLMKALEQYI